MRVKHLAKVGLVEDGPNKRGQYLVSLGSLNTWVNAADLELLPGSKKRRGKHSRTFQPVSTGAATVSMKVDLHGLTRDEAVRKLEEALDRALQRGCGRLEVVHGIGGGVLKEAAHEYLTSSRHVASFALDPANPGTTWAYL